MRGRGREKGALRQNAGWGLWVWPGVTGGVAKERGVASEWRLRMREVGVADGLGAWPKRGRGRGREKGRGGRMPAEGCGCGQA